MQSEKDLNAQPAQDDQSGKKKIPVTTNIDENINNYLELFSDCSDIKNKILHLGVNKSVTCMIAYIEVAVGNMVMDKSVLGQFINQLGSMPDEQIVSYLRENAIGLSDMLKLETIEDTGQAMLTGDAVVFVDGLDVALKIGDKGYPSKGVGTTESEKVVRGSNEGFTESVKANTALLRKRLKTPDLKVQEIKCGTRSRTNVDIVYLKELVYPDLLKEVKERLERYEVDGVLDSGVLEQLAENCWYSPFPQFQSTERPDMAAKAMLEGRVVVLSDNSPYALILPATYNSFIQTTDDYYNRFEIASFTRFLRYVASFLSMAFPGLYLAVTNFHTEILPTKLVLFFAQERESVPFPGIVEILIMELAFELLREAGVRLPAAMGNTIGIVGGLVIGQAAVDAGLVSPMVVIVVAFTALCSFAVPNEEFATAFRLIKFGLIFLCAWLGFFGFLYGMLLVVLHLAGLSSFGIPYLMPFVGADLNDYHDEQDSIIRQPYTRLTHRPIFAKRHQRVRLKRKE